MVPVSRLGAPRLYRLAHWRWLGVDTFGVFIVATAILEHVWLGRICPGLPERVAVEDEHHEDAGWNAIYPRGLSETRLFGQSSGCGRQDPGRAAAPLDRLMKRQPPSPWQASGWTRWARRQSSARTVRRRFGQERASAATAGISRRGARARTRRPPPRALGRVHTRGATSPRVGVDEHGRGGVRPNVGEALQPQRALGLLVHGRVCLQS